MVQAAHNREHGWSISFTLCRGLHTLPTVRVKVLKNFEPNHVMLIRHHTTLPRCDCIGTLRSLYKGMQKTNDLHSYRSGRTITLPSGQHLSKGCYTKRTGLYPCNLDPPLLLSEKGHQINAHLIHWLRSEPCNTVVAHVFLGGSPCFNWIIWSCITKSIIVIKHISIYLGKPFLSNPSWATSTFYPKTFIKQGWSKDCG
jgi:hypothetical protein